MLAGRGTLHAWPVIPRRPGTQHTHPHAQPAPTPTGGLLLACLARISAHNAAVLARLLRLHRLSRPLPTAGQIGYALCPMVARGAMLGPDQPVILHLLDIEPAKAALEGVKMELLDAAFPLVQGGGLSGGPLLCVEKRHMHTRSGAACLPQRWWQAGNALIRAQLRSRPRHAP